MTKVWIDGEGDRYPVYALASERVGYEVEAAPDQIERWRQVQQAWETAQDEMADLFRAAEEQEEARREEEAARREAEQRAERERVERERREAAEARAAVAREARDRLEASGGVVYDAEGNRIGTVTDAPFGLRLNL